MSYEAPPKPGTYYIKSVAAPKNVMEIHDFNPERAVCSPKTEEPALNQQWYIQRSGRGYKIKNVKHGLYLVPHSAHPRYATTVGASPNHAPMDWNFMRTHDGFSIQYGEEDYTIDLHCGLSGWGNPMHLWNIGPQEPAKRWKLEQISNDVGGEVAEAVEDRIAVLSDRIRKQEIEIATRDAEIAAKDRLLARQVQELQDALQTRCKVPSNVVKAQLAELRAKIEGLERLMSV